MFDPASLKYTKTHEWAHVENGICTVGVTPLAVELLNEVTYLKLPKVGAEVKLGKDFGEIVSVKSVNNLYAPADGVVTAVNAVLNDNSNIVNQDPTGEGWIMKFQLAPGAKLDHLLDLHAYQEFCKSEGH